MSGLGTPETMESYHSEWQWYTWNDPESPHEVKMEHLGEHEITPVISEILEMT